MNSEVFVSDNLDKIPLLRATAATILEDRESELPARLAKWGNGVRYYRRAGFCDVQVQPDAEITAAFSNGAGDFISTHPLMSEWTLAALDYLEPGELSGKMVSRSEQSHDTTGH